jgi:hypothetical protein
MDTAEQFAPLVQVYVHILEHADQVLPYTLLSNCAQILPRLYSSGLVLPIMFLVDDVANGEDIEEPIWSLDLAQHIGPYTHYHQIHDSIFAPTIVGGDIASDLEEIYYDLKPPLAGFLSGEERLYTSAVNTWYQHIHGSCGERIVNVLQGLHFLLNGNMPMDYISPEETPWYS